LAGNLALALAIGAAIGAMVEFAVHAVQLIKRKRKQSEHQP
jgi:hypothetical protein